MFQEVPALLLVFPEETGRQLEQSGHVTGHHWMVLEVSGHLWACLGGSRMFGHRLMLAGQSCRHQVGIAHGRSRIEVVEVREQLGGQGVLCIEVCGILWGVGTPSISHLWGGGGGNHSFMGGRENFRWS